MHSAEKIRDTTGDDENYVRCSDSACNMTSVLMTALGNQPIRFCAGTLYSVTSPKLSLQTSVMTSHVTCTNCTYVCAVWAANIKRFYLLRWLSFSYKLVKMLSVCVSRC